VHPNSLIRLHLGFGMPLAPGRLAMASLSTVRTIQQVCPRCHMSLRERDAVAFTGEHLDCFAADLVARGRGTNALFATDRREYPRYLVSREAQLVFSGGTAYAKVRTLNVSAYGLAVEQPDRLPVTLYSRGTVLEVTLLGEDSTPLWVRRAEVRHVTDGAVGLKVAEEIPLALFDLPHDI